MKKGQHNPKTSAMNAQPIPEEDVLPDVRVKWPHVWDYLALSAYDDGTARQRATVTLFVDQDGPKACLNDRDLGRTLWRSGISFVALLDSLEAALADDSADWRHKPADWKKGR